MPDPSNDPTLSMFAFGMMLLSIAACMHLISMRRKGTVLPYEPRRPVPWGVIGCIPAVTFTLMVLLDAIGDGGGSDVAASPKLPTTSSLITAILGQSIIVAAFLSVIAIFTKATRRDVGLPRTNSELIRDVLIGAAACLAALAPVHITQVALMSAFFPDHSGAEHPMIKMVMAAPDPMILFLTGVATVVVAPICEEITFRLLLQGCLERWEDAHLGWRRPKIETAPVSAEEPVAGDQQIEPEPVSPDAALLLPETEPPRSGVAGLPYGWFPILVSAAIFGLAHFGYGPQPIPILLLGLVLGYLYQRTHRIVPSIVCHALFNLFTMIMLWRMIYHHN